MFEHGQHVGAGALEHLQGEQRPVLFDPHNGRRNGQSRGGVDGADFQQAMAALAQMIDLTDKLPGVIQCDLGKPGHMTAQIGQRHAAWQARKHFKVQLVLDLPQHLAHRGLADVHFMGGGMHVLRARQGVYKHQMAIAQPVAQLIKSDISHPITSGY